jgi:hypothetical protein
MPEDATDHNLPLMAWFAMEPLVSTDMNRALALAVDSKLPRILNFTTRRVAPLERRKRLPRLRKR